MKHVFVRIFLCTLLGCATAVSTLSLTGCSVHEDQSGCTSVRCHGTTKSGNRCARYTTKCSGYCWQH